MLPSFYQIYLQANLSSVEYLLLPILINLLQSIKKLSLDDSSDLALSQTVKTSHQDYLLQALIHKRFGKCFLRDYTDLFGQ